MMGLLDDDSVLDLRPRGRKTDPAAFIERERLRAPRLPAENPALREWTDRPSAPPAAPDALGACAECGSRQARVRCAQCGRPACAAHAWSMLGLCKACVGSAESVPIR